MIILMANTIHPDIKLIPPMGVIMPNTLNAVMLSAYKLPENKIIPISSK